MLLLQHCVTTDLGVSAANVNKVREAALQLSHFAAPLINDRFSRGIAAVIGCIPRSKDGLCKCRYLRKADVAGCL